MPTIDVRFAVGQRTRLPFYSRMLDIEGETLLLGGNYQGSTCWQVPLAGSGTPAIVPMPANFPIGNTGAQPWIFANPDVLQTGLHTVGRADAAPVSRVVIQHSDCYAYTNDVRVIEFSGPAPSFGGDTFPGSIGSPAPTVRDYVLPTLRYGPGTMLTLCAAPYVTIDATQATVLLILADASRTVYVQRYALDTPVANGEWLSYWQAQAAGGAWADPNTIGDFDWKLYRLASIQIGRSPTNDPAAIFQV